MRYQEKRGLCDAATLALQRGLCSRKESAGSLQAKAFRSRQGERDVSTISLWAIPLALFGADAASLVCEMANVDVGVVKTGQRLCRQFTLTNHGNQTVEIIGASAACGCLKPTFSRMVLAPGEQSDLRVEVNTLTQPAGPKIWPVRVVYRLGKETHELNVSIRARLIEEITIRPPRLAFHACGLLKHVLIVQDRRDSPLRIMRIESSAPFLKAGDVTEIEPGTYRVPLILSEACPPGRRDEVVCIYTNDTGYGELRIPVEIDKRAKRRVTAYPNRVHFLASRGNPALSRIVALRSDDDQPIAIEKVIPDHQAISCRWSTASAPGCCRPDFHRSTRDKRIRLGCKNPRSAQTTGSNGSDHSGSAGMA
ncbi:MAG: hypothetical protein KatS3mg105_0130 [Gemmatales bacterium]|nr:MAG: hypothetical protein KatS3mg105_0130 [Gemmatales bacterium]